jgi:ribokinase
VRAADLSDADLSRARILVLQMEVRLEESRAIAARARRAGARVLWNLAPAPTEAERASLPALLAATDILIVNELEANATARLLGLTAADAKAAAAALARRHRVACIVTEGAAGATAFAADGGSLYAPAPAITPVDTTGAGDTFVGVLAGGLAEEMELAVAMTRACRAASLACLAAGAQSGMPDRATLAMAEGG